MHTACAWLPPRDEQQNGTPDATRLGDALLAAVRFRCYAYVSDVVFGLPLSGDTAHVALAPILHALSGVPECEGREAVRRHHAALVGLELRFHRYLQRHGFTAPSSSSSANGGGGANSNAASSFSSADGAVRGRDAPRPCLANLAPPSSRIVDGEQDDEEECAGDSVDASSSPPLRPKGGHLPPGESKADREMAEVAAQQALDFDRVGGGAGGVGSSSSSGGAGGGGRHRPGALRRREASYLYVPVRGSVPWDGQRTGDAACDGAVA